LFSVAGFPRELLSVDLRCDRFAPAVVREAIMGVGALDSVRGDALLVATELVTELVVHAEAGPEEWIQVRITELERSIVISARGPAGSPGRVRLQPAGIQAGDEIRPLLFHALTSRWGTERERGYHVWAELSTP
jgi:hypothetical protein